MRFLMGDMVNAKVEAGQPYSLTVLNQNSKFQQFALFQTIPDIVGPSVNPVSLAWMLGGAAPGSVSNPSQSVFSWEINYQVNTGYIQDQGTTINPRRFTTASNADVMINTQNAIGITYLGPFPYGAPAFPAGPTNGKAGLISVQSDDKIPTAVVQASQSVSVNVGIAMNAKPTIVVQALPNLLYQFTPKPTYYIIAGSFVQGQVIDTATSSNAYQVAYQGVTDRTIIFTEQNQFQDS
ncbi:hypothetical protein EN836_11805 [Mesorhizobium sp. M1C.F.Ca.ET.193.01.1.1]|uniref:hypothetical protein n=1 Tax=unclassified Mesorhizobium TaxID=325217 RepID=UPI000FD3E05D|nr:MULTISPECIES: hypothetical protein [unclassified Mesorhizobium]TGT01438.1 hypothetical protein EN820_30535 [bacterium M00.F.Ca.ET.177.01.1.1]TGQ54197.1 hypothetical protein EN853_11805 [Mesorhizobium sp. M1C.F.Ca.ET.210.01.1.1]TGQ72210.1 hypothetical protein EN855_011815 [Mesorhizobium sp. M1C.F.Ca.ET.212.01.1.1]TGR10026.1 hypothetical protein EN847_11810 [Mesorhizobium sp. M1C.F.Ca.ET.204.01.1.1]TGR30146.1 hypothetical protein EN839_11810 [Mesorhizobium sp. M1C.F.Ca.ET.196.01.1.1]